MKKLVMLLVLLSLSMNAYAGGYFPKNNPKYQYSILGNTDGACKSLADHTVTYVKDINGNRVVNPPPRSNPLYLWMAKTCNYNCSTEPCPWLKGAYPICYDPSKSVSYPCTGGQPTDGQ